MSFDNFFEEPDGLTEYDEMHAGILSNLNMLKSMSVEESTFHKKWVEVQDYVKFANQSGVTKALIWKPSDIFNKEKTLEELDALQPEIVFVEPSDERLCMDWLMIRVFVHTMPFDQTPGRFLRFLVRDSVTGKYLGATSIASDVIVITDRDKYIGWTKEQKLEGDKKLNYSAIGSCIMATQPFGYNFLGAKLTAAIITTKTVRDVWEKLYRCKMVGMTTTSLYGTKSFYNSVPQWRKCGASAGKISIKPDEQYYKWWHDYVKKEYATEYKNKMTQKENVSGPVTGAKQRVIDMIFKHLKIKGSNYTHGYMRGVYYSCFYENTREFLRGEIDESSLKVKPSVEADINGIISWWKPKAKDRYLKLLENNLLKPDVTYYNKMIGEDYVTAKEMFFGEVGR